MNTLAAAGVGVSAAVLAAFLVRPRLTNDGATFMLAAAGRAVASPFRWRVLYQWLLRAAGCGGEVVSEEAKGATVRFVGVRNAFIIGYVGIAAAVFAFGINFGWYEAALFFGSGWGKIMAYMLTQADHIAWPLALFAMAAGPKYGIPLAMGAGLAHERAPIFLAMWTREPLYLLGCVPVAVAALLAKKGAPTRYEADSVRKPVRTAWIAQSYRGVLSLVAPLGLFAFGVDESNWWVGVVAYLQIFVATDRVRLYTWCLPALVPSVPAAYRFPAFAAHWTISWLCVEKEGEESK
jgi:hypothetical protein